MNLNDPRPVPDSALEGVVFSAEHLAGFWRRLVASSVDCGVLFALYVTLFNVWLSLVGLPWINALTFLLAATLIAAIYIGPLKRSWLRTVGYRVAGVRIVNLRGERPALTMMLLRAALYIAGTGFALIDMIWILGQHPRRKLSDLVAGTYVVRISAQPMGRGEVVLAYYAIFGHFWILREVRPDSSMYRKVHRDKVDDV